MWNDFHGFNSEASVHFKVTRNMLVIFYLMYEIVLLHLLQVTACINSVFYELPRNYVNIECII